MEQSTAGKQSAIIHPKKFLVWLIIVSICMLFAAMTSAYIVRKGEGNWLEFELPKNFLYSSIVIVISSITLHFGTQHNKNGDTSKAQLFVGLTTILGLVFLVLQYMSWVEVYNYKYPVVFGGSMSNPSGSFLYVLSGLHAAHLITGVLYLMIVLVLLFIKNINKENRLHLEMCTTFWHFLGGLWLYLYLFLTINH